MAVFQAQQAGSGDVEEFRQREKIIEMWLAAPVFPVGPGRQRYANGIRCRLHLDFSIHPHALQKWSDLKCSHPSMTLPAYADPVHADFTPCK